MAIGWPRLQDMIRPIGHCIADRPIGSVTPSVNLITWIDHTTGACLAAPRARRSGLSHQGVEQGMRPSGGPSRNSTPGWRAAQFLPGPRQVAEQMDARREEIRDHQHARRTAGHAPAVPPWRCRARPARGSTPRRSDIASRGEPRGQLRADRRWPPGAGCRGRSEDDDWHGSVLELLSIAVQTNWRLGSLFGITNAARTGGGIGRVDPSDGLPDDLVEDQIIGAVLDLEVEPLRQLGHGGAPRVLGVDVHAGRAVDIGL